MSEASVVDILLEAAEYLSKLGNNLKSRTENIKHKRLNRNKLKNTYSVQKAADKILVICELSKKSLDNVEIGVKKVLESVNIERKSSNNPNNYDSDVERNLQVSGSKDNVNTDEKCIIQSTGSKEYQYLKVNSHKVKILKNVPLKHFLSCSVKVNKITSEICDKYPVYYNCKLYRRRLRTSIENKQLEKEYISLPNLSSRPETEDKSYSNENIDQPDVPTTNSERLHTDNSETASEAIELDKSKCSSNLQEQAVKIGDLKDKSQTKAREKISTQNKKITINKILSTEDNEEKEAIPEIILDTALNDCKDQDIKSTSDPEHQGSSAKSQLKCVNTDNLKSQEEKVSDDSQVNITSQERDLDNCNSENDKSGDVSNSSTALLRCVDINKLLKSSIKEDIPEQKIKPLLKPSWKIQLKSKTKHKKNIPSKNIKHMREKREEKEKLQISAAKAFKAKEFHIKLSQLPKFDKEFLIKHKIRQITQNNVVIMEVKSEDNNNVSNKTHNGIKDKRSPSMDIAKVKNALLHDSDSDREDIKENSEAAKLKHALLVDSDDGDAKDNTTNMNKGNSECDGNRPESPKEVEAVLQVKNDNSIDVSNKDLDINQAGTATAVSDLDDRDPSKVKSRLLSSNSDTTVDKSPKGKRKCLSDVSTPSSKKKYKDSVAAKKMLLNYSSSDTDDEQLKNALLEIKEYLSKDVQSQAGSPVKKAAKSKNRFPTSDSNSDKCKNNTNKSCSATDSNESLKQPQKKKKLLKKRRVNKNLDNDSDSHSSIGQVDGNMDSGDKKMGRNKGKAATGSGQSTDTQDSLDKDIDGLTNLKTLNKVNRRRRVSTSTDDTSVTVQRSMRERKPIETISKENMLEAESNSSEEMSDANSGGTEELPAVVASLNGSGPIDYLAKDDLLEESDSSNSHSDNGDSERSDVKKEHDSEDDDTVRLKRRKGNAISSESEGGTSKKKDGRRISDFDESDDDSSEEGKKKKRKKKKVVDSDASNSGSSDGSSKKKRRRIKSLKDSDCSGSGSENEGRKHGRKNIRKVMGKDQLEEATKKAARQEKERIARISERQKVYNNLAFDETGKPDEVVLDKVVLDFDPETKEPLIEVDPGLVKKLKPHQANGIKFMWDACFESVKRIKKDKGSGCILAHCMGLGKTLQVVSLTHTLLTHNKLTGVNRVLVVCPLSTVLNWVNEYRMWLKHAHSDMEVDIYELSRFKQNSERAYQLQEWLDNGGVCVLGYEMFRNLSADNNKKFRKKMLKSFQESLLDPGPDMVVCDEGHLLKNEKTSLSQSMNRVKSLRRIVLTGTPLQNNLKEYYCMVQFVKPNLLGKYNEYLNRFVNPITNGQYTDSTEQDIRVMKRRSHVLHKMLDGAVQRRDYGVLAPFLPPKHEYVLFITLTDLQVTLYQHYMDNYSRRPLQGKAAGFLFPDFQSLQRIWTHPLVLKYNSERYEIMQQKKKEREEEEDSEGSLIDFIDDDSTPDETSSEESTEDSSASSEDGQKKNKKKKSSKKKAKDLKTTRRGTRGNPVEMPEEEEEKKSDVEEVKNENPTEWWIPLVTDEELEDLRNSHKLVLLFDILQQCEAIGDKLLVFSQSLYSLDLIEHFLGKIDEATQDGRVDDKLGSHVGSWSPGIDYFRLDGSTSCENRSIWCKNFNKEDNPRARLFLISTRAGGLGINLVAANRVVIFDVSWNPSHDVQSIFRVYRFGQKKPCYVYRFLAMGTMEEKIYERQVTKQAISKRVIDEQQIDRHYAENDLAELYNFTPKPPEPRPIPPLPKDRLFAEMLKEHDKLIYKYHEHDSLLENKEEETLTEEERKAAWEDFENEKNRPAPMPFNAWPMQNDMAGLMAQQQQQQQLAYAALISMLRKEYPNLSEAKLASMLPILYNSNPGMFGGFDFGLMQKISDMYSYSSQNAAMMNPGLMNPGLMNSAGMGGSSGLQYEPPWQRQQVQQQQMRLQQMMQQQHNMGAKFYAGGLGSRDPVAMALQQQRAREMLVGEATRGRPRGRPPGPRAPPTATGDIVDLDSD